jgi:hypothetical protein
MKVFISASVNIFEVEVEPTDTIDQLRVKFIEKYGHSFRTRFKGRIISEGKILLMPTIVTLNLSKGEIERERKILANYGVKEGTKMYFLPFLLSGGSDICYVRLAGPARPEGEEKRKYGYYRVLMPNLTLEEFKLRILEEEIQYFNEEGKSLLGIMSREENQEIQSLKNESNTIIERIRSNTNLNKQAKEKETDVEKKRLESCLSPKLAVISNEMVLSYNGQAMLQNDRHMSTDYKVSVGSTLDVIRVKNRDYDPPPWSVDISIQLKSGDNFSLILYDGLYGDQTISDLPIRVLKERIKSNFSCNHDHRRTARYCLCKLCEDQFDVSYESIDASIEDQVLFYNSKLMKDDRTFGSYGIYAGITGVTIRLFSEADANKYQKHQKDAIYNFVYSVGYKRSNSYLGVQQPSDCSADKMLPLFRTLPAFLVKLIAILYVGEFLFP